MKRKIFTGLLMLAAGLCFTAGTAQAIDLFDGDVVIHGKISEQLLMRAHDTRSWEQYDYNVFNARSTLKLETMWHAFKGPEYQVNFYGVFKQFYDAADHIDGNYKRMLYDAAGGTDKAINEVRSYSNFKDISREIYTELNGPMFQVRLGKQIVSWGETSFERMVDDINPIDQRGNLNPSYPDFAEIKQGLWMGRFFFTPPDQPMDMTYEFLVIPDFEPTILNPVGYHNTHPRAFNSLNNPNEMYEAYYRDAPHDSFSKPEWGARIRGFLAGWDWTLSFFNHRVDDGVVAPNRALKQGIGPALGSTNFTRNADLNFAHLNNLYPLSNVYRYPWQQDVGFTVNKPIDMTIPIIPGTDLAMSGNIFRMEALWEHNKPALHVKGLGGLNSDITRQNRFAVCLRWDTKVFMPLITPLCRNKLLSWGTQIFYEKMPSKHSSDYYYPWVTYAQKRSSWTMISQELSYELWNGRILPGFYGAYYTTNGGGYWGPAIAFKPNFGHTFLVRYLAYSHLKDSPANVDSKDSWTFEYTYEF